MKDLHGTDVSKNASEETDLILDNDILNAIEILEPLGIAKSTLDNIVWISFALLEVVIQQPIPNKS